MSKEFHQNAYIENGYYRTRKHNVRRHVPASLNQDFLQTGAVKELLLRLFLVLSESTLQVKQTAWSSTSLNLFFFMSGLANDTALCSGSPV